MYRSILQGAWGLKSAPLIPNDPQTLRGLAGVPEDVWEKHGANVMRMFELSEDTKSYSHERLSRDWREARSRMKKNADKASKGGKAKQAKRLAANSKSTSSTPQAAPRVLEPAYNTTEQDIVKPTPPPTPPAKDWTGDDLAGHLIRELGISSRFSVAASAALTRKAAEPGWTMEKAFEHLLAAGKKAKTDRFAGKWDEWFDGARYDREATNGNRGFVPR